MRTIFLAILSVSAAPAAMQVKLATSVPSPQPVGAVIGLIPRLQISAPGLYNYRYAVSVNGGSFRIVRDFTQQGDFAWTPELYEHESRIRITVRNNATRETAEAELPFRIVSRIRGSNPAITATAHPLVALFSAPACPDGTQFRVAFRRQGEEAMTRTPAEPCRANISNNVLVAGMRADTDYQMRAELVKGGSVKTGAWMPFHTGLADGRFPAVSTAVQRSAGQPAADGIVIRSLIDPWRSAATDLDGNLLWYLTPASPSFLTRVLPGGRFLVHADGANSVNDMKRWQVLREVNLLGNTIRETNIGRLAEQLEERGIKSECKKGGQQCVSGFHHEAMRLPNGHTLVLAGLERMFPAGTQGAKEAVDILGDLVLDLDPDFQLAWYWNSFDHMDLNRASIGNEKCKGGPGDDGCTPVFLAAEANGWLHSNAIHFNPRTGDLLVSIPEQDWIVKLDYKNGKGSGKVLWRLGQGGDFTAKSDDPNPWFSYQHDPGFDPETGLLVVFDDGHRRKDKDPKANNRGQAWKIDEESRTATPVLNADLGVYALAVGSAQALSDGSYSFEAGLINAGPAGLGAMYSRTVETSSAGKVTYAQQVDGGLTYRSFRVPDMYSAPRK